MRKQKILIVDDSELNRAILSDILSEDYEVAEACDGLEAINYLRSDLYETSLIFLDINMPRMDGLAVLDIMNKFKWIEEVPVIIISAETESRKVERAYELGATDFIQRPFDAPAVRRRAVNTMMLYAKQKKLTQIVEEQLYAREKEQSLMVNIMSYIVEYRNGESGFHIFNIRTITEQLLRNLLRITDRYTLSSQEISLIATASGLHDIGKIMIESEILNKADKLDAGEWKRMQQHTTLGAEMIQQYPFYETEPLLRHAYEVARWHHERYDGKGYPDGLKGEEIPISAQVVGLADAYDALTNFRSYKKAVSHAAAVQMIRNGECGAFNPLLLKVLDMIADSLPAQLRIGPMKGQSEWGVSKLMREVMSDKELTSAGYAVEFLEREREKIDFYTTGSKRVMFEICAEPLTVNFMPASARLLGVENTNFNPLTNERLLAIMDETTMRGLYDALKTTSETSPETEYPCTVTVNGQRRICTIRLKALYTRIKNNEEPVLIGAFAKTDELF